MSVHSTEMFELIGVWAFHCVQFDDDLGLKSWSSGMHLGRIYVLNPITESVIFLIVVLPWISLLAPF